MRHAGSLLRSALLVLGALLAAGCATIPPGAGTSPADPWEVYNRHVFDFNDRVDRALTRPLAEFYVGHVPDPVRQCLGGVFNNLGDVPSALNNLLQGKPAAALTDLCRVAINSTVGLLGCFDMAAKMGLARSDEDFGQTLGRWGLAAGPYFVWPLLGPSSVRDSVGRVAGFYTDPLDALRPIDLRNALAVARLIDTRAQLLPAERVMRAAALDWYEFVRDSYLLRRASLVHDGDPPRAPDDFDDEAPTEAPRAPAPAPTAATPASAASAGSSPPARADQSDAVPARWEQ